MTINLIISLLFSLNNLHGLQQQGPKLNTVEFSHIAIVNQVNKVYRLGPAKDLQKAFGVIKAKKDTDEVLGGFGYTYNYNGLEVYFNKGNREGTTIKNREYRILLNGHAYAVGDPISKLQNQFPISYKNRYTDSRLILIFITNGKIMADASVSMLYNARGIITEIGVDNDNS